MAFSSLTEKLTQAFQKLRSKGRLTEADVKEATRSIKMALLEADVNYKVVKEFIATVNERAIGQNVLESLTPAQQVIKIVNEELTALMGSEVSKIKMASSPPTILMLCGLQGVGKTTTCAKLANYYKKNQDKRPLLVACDTYRPAAIEQLKISGKQLDIPVFTGEKDPVSIAVDSVAYAKSNGFDLVIIDTAGRTQINEEMMQEVYNIKSAVQPTEIIYVVDAMAGQDAVNTVTAFNDLLQIDGILLTKLDGDARGGAALSVKAVTGKPIKFCGTGEKLDQLEPFYPDRMASRILGMGDMLSLIEKAQKEFDEKKAIELSKKIENQTLSLTDFYDQLVQMRKMGSMREIMAMMPGVNPNSIRDADIDEKHLNRIEAIIQSMTPEERNNPDLLNYSRKRRIASGCGQSVEDINRLLKQFSSLQKLTKQLSSAKPSKIPGLGKLGGLRLPF